MMEKLQPKLRFPEFKDEWQKSYVKDHTEQLNGFAFKSENLITEQNGYRVLRGINITEGRIRNNSEIDRYYNGDLTKLNKYKVEVNDLVIAMDGSKVGKNISLVTKKNDGELLVQRVSRLREKNSNIKFIYHLINNYRFHNYVDKVNTSSGIPHISSKQIDNYELLIPSLEEQTKIADFLGAVDKQLDILNQKKEKLNTYKKGVMQQLFSQQLRFKDDNGNDFPEWEEKTLGEIGNSFNGLTGKTAKDFGEGKKYIQYKQIFDKPYIDFNDCGFVNIIENEKQNECKIGDVFFTVSSETKEEIAMSSVIESSVDFPVYLNSFCFGIRFKENVLIPKFSRFYFRNEIFRKNVIVLAQGSTRFNLSKVNFMKLAITIPSIEEQTKIANFLSAIDNQIETVSIQIQKTENYKKGLLQQMFV